MRLLGAAIRGHRHAHTDVVMVLENCGYPLDARVRMEAETLLESGLSVEVLAPREHGRPAREVIHGVRVARFPLPDGNGTLPGTAIEYLVAAIAVSAAMMYRLARTRTATLHVHNPPDLFFPLLWLARKRGWSTVFDHHDDAAGMLRAKLGRRTFPEILLAWMRNQSARIADLTITTNESQRALVQPVAREVVVVRNSPPVWFADHKPAPPAGRARLVFLGEIGAQDRVERTVEILSHLVNDRKLDVELLIIGDGPRRRQVESYARKLGVGPRVTTTGWVPFEQVPVLLASAHVGLDTAPPSEVNHGSTMMKISEYLVVGLPVVATALRETLVTGGDAVTAVTDDSLGSFADPIVKLLSSRAEWHRSALRARQRGTELQWPAQRDTLLAAYGRLCTGETLSQPQPTEATSS
jgi:glycosyltransferase involved in cell wall biosynthesis